MGKLVIEDLEGDTLSFDSGEITTFVEIKADFGTVHLKKPDLIKLRDFINVELKKLGEDQIVIRQCMCRPYNSLSEAELDNNKCTQCDKPIKPQG